MSFMPKLHLCHFSIVKQLAAFDNFFAKDGCQTISFVYQESEVPGIGEYKSRKIIINCHTLASVSHVICYYCHHAS